MSCRTCSIHCCRPTFETFPQYLFNRNAFKYVTPMIWWEMLASVIPVSFRGQTTELCCKLFTAVASTAGLEHIFSSFWLVHFKLRNRLGNEKATKLTFLFLALIKKATHSQHPRAVVISRNMFALRQVQRQNKHCQVQLMHHSQQVMIWRL